MRCLLYKMNLTRLDYETKLRSKGIMMNYQEFTDLWHETIKLEGMPGFHALHTKETIGVSSMSREYRTFFYGPRFPITSTFQTSVEISWVWDALLSARYATTEEDMLMEIFGDFGIHEDTEPPWLRVDLCLSASTDYGSEIPLPLLDQWQRWLNDLSREIDPFLPGGSLESNELAWHGLPEATIRFDLQGATYLKKVKLHAWQGITLPRQWDDPEKYEPDPSTQLHHFVSNLRQSLNIWQTSFENFL